MDKLIDKYRPANYEDCFRQTLIGKERMKPRDLFDLIFVQYPKPAQYLLKFRDMLVKPLGLKTGGGFADMIIEENETGLVIGKRILTFMLCWNVNPRQGICRISAFRHWSIIITA